MKVKPLFKRPFEKDFRSLLTLALLVMLMVVLIGLRCYGLDPILTKSENLIRAGKIDDGKQIIARYLTAHETAEAYTQVGALYARLRRWSDSVHYLEIANKRNSKDPLILYKLALAQHQSKQTDPAVASLRQALGINLKFDKAYFALGEILELSHDRYDARNNYISALSKIGDRPLLRSKLCWLNFEDHFFSETIKQCTKATQLDGADTASWALLARTQYLNQNRPEAFKIFHDVLLRYPQSALLFKTRGLIYYEEKAYEQAINDLGRAFGLDSTDDEAAIHLARSYFELGHYDKALPLFVEACKIDRDYRFEFLSKQREVARKGQDDLAAQYQLAIDKF